MITKKCHLDGSLADSNQHISGDCSGAVPMEVCQGLAWDLLKIQGKHRIL